MRQSFRIARIRLFYRPDHFSEIPTIRPLEIGFVNTTGILASSRPEGAPRCESDRQTALVHNHRVRLLQAIVEITLKKIPLDHSAFID